MGTFSPGVYNKAAGLKNQTEAHRNVSNGNLPAAGAGKININNNIKK